MQCSLLTQVEEPVVNVAPDFKRTGSLPESSCGCSHWRRRLPRGRVRREGRRQAPRDAEGWLEVEEKVKKMTGW